MLWSLSLLTVIGQCFFVSCRLYEYHLIEENKTWDQAQDYCRKKYTDLASVSDMNDAKRISELVKQAGAWIGLHSNQGAENKRWHWSMPELPDVELSDIQKYFQHNQPNNHGGKQNCVDVSKGKLNDKQCSKSRRFICFNASTETNSPNERFILIDEQMTWTAAQQYCREHHTDLASGLDLLDDTKFLSLVSESTRRWIGLFRDTWRWSDGSNSSFRHWDEPEDVFEKGKCAFVMEESGKWSSEDCDHKKPFICYDDKMILVNKTLTWEGALDYCREHYRDLVCINDHEQQELVQAKAEQADTDHVWLGMRYTCVLDLWFWVNDNLVCYYKNWKPTDEYMKNECYHAGAMEKSGQWVKRPDNETFNFVCALN